MDPWGDLGRVPETKHAVGTLGGGQLTPRASVKLSQLNPSAQLFFLCF